MTYFVMNVFFLVPLLVIALFMRTAITLAGNFVGHRNIASYHCNF
jgi:hypothetical protein